MSANRDTLKAALPHTLAGVDDPAPFYRGKVRDVYARGDELLLVASDRVSAFDVVLGTIPFKGQLLTEQAAFWLEKAAAVVETHLLDRPDPQAMRVRRSAAIPVELVVRGYLAGSLLREPKESRGHAYGLKLDPALADYAAFPEPVLTPTTKEAVGVHDQPCSLAELVSSGRVTKRHLDRCVEVAVALFKMGQTHARAHGLLLVDTKYEMGLIGDRVVLIDELHTADSSRFWVANSYAERVGKGEAPEMLDKERLRRWLIGQGFSGHGTPPALSDEVRIDLAFHYWDLTERLMGRPYTPVEGDALTRVSSVVRDFMRA
ncbi:MAG: phosphoribosylaminoimidazolesuccinocarboxamide synthase [Deltaproteobacteria bacterium]|nr:phosphoribosylaminoimidazolesuccinocarboxamide synthase [Deltaproteobacteria bacterium]